MNYKMTGYILGRLLGTEAVLMALPLLVGVVLKEAAAVHFVYVMLLLLALSVLLSRKRPVNDAVYAREGFLIVAVGWLLVSFFGALPFVFSGEIPSLVDAVFETVSGFTTTGSSILTDVTALSKCMLFWRSFTHWVGGMGVLVFIMAVMPLAGSQNIHIMRAESPGHEVTKLVPRTRKTALILYEIYIGLTVMQLVFMLAGGVPFLDSLMLTFGTAGTGGFGVLNDSITSYSPYIQVVITTFMILFGINFGCYFLVLTGSVKEALKNTEVRTYLLIIASVVGIITLNIRHLYGSLGESLRYAAFQVGSLITTTGYTTANYDLWPRLSQVLLLMVMCIGACSGSTGGGIKVSRVIVLMKQLRREIKVMIHPNSVTVTTYDGKRLSHEVSRGVSVYLFAYVLLLVGSLILVSMDNFSFTTNFSAVIATLNNIGPGLEAVGATGNYAGFSNLSKIVFTMNMLLGRLEIFPMLLLFFPSTWRR